jgi:hypothetical protein
VTTSWCPEAPSDKPNTYKYEGGAGTYKQPSKLSIPYYPSFLDLANLIAGAEPYPDSKWSLPSGVVFDHPTISFHHEVVKELTASFEFIAFESSERILRTKPGWPGV